jgi:hypothetical protein
VPWPYWKNISCMYTMTLHAIFLIFVGIGGSVTINLCAMYTIAYKFREERISSFFLYNGIFANDTFYILRDVLKY